jgi:hypothetical protein
MYFATFLFWLTGLTVVIISLLTRAQDEYRTIRTTYWTYKDKSSRPDDAREETLVEQVTKHSSIYFTNSQQPLAKINTNKNEDIEVEVKVKRQLWKKILINWICGLNENETKSETSKINGDLSISIEQTKFQKYILNVNLVIIICVAIGLFIYFSIPPKELNVAYDG